MRSGQVGLVKFLSVQKFRDGVRIELLSGKRAHRYLSDCWAQDVRIAQALSVKPNASFAGVERVLAELSALKQRCAKLEESVFAQTAAQYEGKGDVLLFEDEMSGDSLQALRRGHEPLRRPLRGLCRRGRRVQVRHRACRRRPS